MHDCFFWLFFVICILFELFCLQGPDLIEKANGLHGFMNWKRNLLTVSMSFLNESVRVSKKVECKVIDFTLLKIKII